MPRNYKVSLKGMAEILDHEDITLMPYLDSVNVWTIGAGHTGAAGGVDPAKLPKGVALSLAEVVEIFKRDLPNYEASVNRQLNVDVEQHVFDALVSFHYNTGRISTPNARRPLPGFFTMINSGAPPSSPKVKAAMMQWVIPPEVRGRREKEADLLTKGNYSNKNGTCQIWNVRNNRPVFSNPKTVRVIDLLALDVEPRRFQTLPQENYDPVPDNEREYNQPTDENHSPIDDKKESMSPFRNIMNWVNGGASGAGIIGGLLAGIDWKAVAIIGTIATILFLVTYFYPRPIIIEKDKL